MNKNHQSYLYIFVSALTIGASGYLYSTDVLADADSPIAQVANTSSQTDNPANVEKVALDTPNVQTNVNNQAQQVAAEAISGKVENVSYSIDNGTLRLDGGTLSLSHTSYPWQQNSTITNIEITGPLKLEGSAAAGIFAIMPNLKSINGINNLDTSKTTNMSSMFYGDGSLASLDLSSLNTSKVTDMSFMFLNDSQLTSLDVSKFDTSKVTDMSFMFSHNSSLTSLDVSGFDTSKVTTMRHMFSHIGLTSLDLLNFNTSKVTDMSAMFYGDSGLTNLKISKFDTSEVINMSSMFYQNSGLTSLDVSSFDTSKVTDMSDMFAFTSSLTSLDLSNFHISDSTDFNAMFYDDKRLWILKLGPKAVNSNFNLSSISNHSSTSAIPDSNPIRYASGPGWQAVDAKNAGTVDNPKGTVYDKILTKRPAETEIYVWQQEPAVDLSSLKTTNIDLYLNKSFTDADLRGKIEAKDSDGTSLNYQYTVKDATGKTVAINDVSAKVGQYTIEITTDKLKNGKDPLKGTLTIRVRDGNTLNLKYAAKAITTNQVWHPEDAFDNATDVGGQTLTFKDITVNATDSSGKPVNDLNNLYKTAGIYTVQYTNGSVTKVLKLTVQTPSNPTNPTTPSTPITPSTPTSGGSGSNASTSSSSSNKTNVPSSAAAKGTVVYSIKKIGLYKTTDFTKNTHRSWYAKKPRINRPMFVVTGYARSSNGNLRYRVRDVNHSSRTAGQIGYITASQKYVRPVYYATKHATITVINPRGVNAYRKANLTGKVKNYRQGTVLRVKGIVKHNLTTRYVLSNGGYITANRKLVNMGRHKQVKSVKTKRVINRYGNVNFTKKKQSIAKNRTLKVYGYAYSRSNDASKYGTLRYRVAGGYITANTKYVRAYQ